MAILKSLLLRHRTTALCVVRTRSLTSFSGAAAISSSSVVSPEKATALSSSRPWKWNVVRRFGSAEIVSERLSSVDQSDSSSADGYRPREPDVDDIEGCDFNHWLIVIDFPKDPRPSPEEMVRFYEETCAKTLNLSLEEAKKKIYATSTSNYTGFHVHVTEIESEKFNGQPGVVFVLPDSYIDKEKKEYGGDKYINGVIIPRPRPSKRRLWDEPKQDQQVGPTKPNPQEQTTPYSQEGSTEQPNQPRISPPYTHQGLTQGPERTNEATPSCPPSPPQRYYYIPPGRGEQRSPPNYPFQHTYAPTMVAPRNPYQQGSASFVPYQGNYNQGWTWNYAPPQGVFSWPPQAMSPYGPGVGYSGYQGQVVPEANWHGPYARTVAQGFYGPMQWQCYGPPAGYQVQGPPQQFNWHGQPYSGTVGPGYPTPPIQGQVYTVQPNQGQVYPGQPNQGQGYLGHPNQGQVYPGQPNQGQDYPGQPNQGLGYPGHPNQGQVYPGQPNQGQDYPGQPNQGQGYTGQRNQGQGYPGQLNQGQGYPEHPNQGQGYPGQPNQSQGYPGQPNQGQGYPGQPIQGQVYPGQPNRSQGYAPPGDYQSYGPQQGRAHGQLQQEPAADNGYQGQGSPMEHWRGPNN